DRAARLLAGDPGADRSAEGGPPPAPRSIVLLDELSAGLLDGRFMLRRTGTAGDAVLVGERAAVDETRPLLGRPTPCVGREQELGTLHLLLGGCAEDGAVAVLVTAPPG